MKTSGILRTLGIFLGLALLATRVEAGFFYQGVATNTLYWPGGVVPYEFATNLTAAQKQIYLDGLREWELAANVKFVPRTNQAQYNLFKYDPAGPNSVDLFSTPQVVNINVLSRPQICHEMGHSFGFNHENIRPDQTNYLTVLTNNIFPAANISLFTIDPNGVTNGTYDFESVMHLGRNFSSIDPDHLDTQLARPAYQGFQPRMGNLALSKGDRAALRYLYGPGPVLTNVVTTTSDGGTGSLRAALYYAIDHPGTTVRFNIPTNDPGFSNGVFTIHLTAHLPPLVTDGTVLDGATQPGFAGNPLIFIDGSQIFADTFFNTGLLIYAANGAVKNLACTRFNWNGLTLLYADATNNLIAGCWSGLDFSGTNAAPNVYQGILVANGASRNFIGGTNALLRNVLSGNTQYGLLIGDSNTTGNVVLGNYIGPGANGTTSVANVRGGILISGGTRNNLLGGTNAAARNVISGNLNFGLWIGDPNTDNNTVQGNYIGLNAGGTAALPNTFAGMYVIDGARSNLVTGNVISGNASDGLSLRGAGTSANRVQGNFLGTGPAGTNAIPNGFAGLTLFAGATGNFLGGTTAAARNVISGNSTVGLAFGDVGTSGNVAEGNFIGTDPGGSNAVANGFAGVYLTGGAQNNTLGGAAAGAGNVISGNGTYGVYVANPTTGGNRIQGNFIGTRANGTNALANGFNGIITFDGAHDNVIGLALDGTGAGNRVAFNLSDGIRLDNTNTTGNTIRGNSVYNNGSLGINLNGGVQNGSGVTTNDVNDADTGPNNLQNFPVLTNVFVSGANTIVNGRLNSTPSRAFIIDFYRNPAADPSGNGEGETYVGSIAVSTAASGNVNFSASVSGTFSNQWFAATTTDLVTGDTSEFSAAKLATNGPAPPKFTGLPLFTSTGFVMNAQLMTGQLYRIQGSSNLTQSATNPAAWLDLTNFTAAATNFVFRDRTATNFPRRFYRMISP